MEFEPDYFKKLYMLASLLGVKDDTDIDNIESLKDKIRLFLQNHWLKKQEVKDSRVLVEHIEDFLRNLEIFFTSETLWMASLPKKGYLAFEKAFKVSQLASGDETTFDWDKVTDKCREVGVLVPENLLTVRSIQSTSSIEPILSSALIKMTIDYSKLPEVNELVSSSISALPVSVTPSSLVTQEVTSTAEVNHLLKNSQQNWSVDLKRITEALDQKSLDELKLIFNQQELISKVQALFSDIVLDPDQCKEIWLEFEKIKIEKLKSSLEIPSTTFVSEPSAFYEAQSAINNLNDEIDEIVNNIKPLNENVESDHSNEDTELSEEEKQLNMLQSTLNQARVSLQNAQAVCYAASTSGLDENQQLLLLNNAKESCDNIVKDIDMVLESTHQVTKANTIIIDPNLRDGQTVLIRNVPDRDKLASKFMEVNKVLFNQTGNNLSQATISARVTGDNKTDVVFRGQALGPNDVVQYTKTLDNNNVIYSEVYKNKAGEPVATDRSVVSSPEDKQKAAMIQAENILANYKGRGEIVLTLDTKSKDPDEDLKRLNMLYAAILLCSKRQAFKSYPAIQVVHPKFEAPKLTTLGITRDSLAENYIKSHLNVNPEAYSTQKDMAKKFKALRTNYEKLDKTLTHGEGVDRKGKLVAPKIDINETEDLTENCSQLIVDPIKRMERINFDDEMEDETQPPYSPSVP